MTAVTIVPCKLAGSEKKPILGRKTRQTLVTLWPLVASDKSNDDSSHDYVPWKLAGSKKKPVFGEKHGKP
jgi:hypothetical protein